MDSFPPPPNPSSFSNNEPTLLARNDGRAVMALVCGALGLVIFGIVFGAVAIWLGIKSRRNISASFGRLKGDRLALAGVVLGVIDVATFFLLVATK